MNAKTAYRQVGLVLSACLAGIVLAIGALSAADAEGNRPNVIVFFTDQQAWDSVGCYGQKLPVTPHLDRMAAEGVRFVYAFTSQPVCGPTRSTLQTGKYATQTGCFRNGIPLPTSEKTIAHRFSEAGYEVGYIGKWHWPRPMPSRCPWSGAAVTKTSGWPATCWSSHPTVTMATCSTARGGSAIFHRADTEWTPRPTGSWSTYGPVTAGSRFSSSSPISSPIIRTITTALRAPRGAGKNSVTTRCRATWSERRATGGRTTPIISAVSTAWTKTSDQCVGVKEEAGIPRTP